MNTREVVLLFSTEKARELFRKETDAFACGSGSANAPTCPLGTESRPLPCDCPSTKELMGLGNTPCHSEGRCIVQAQLFPDGI